MIFVTMSYVQYVTMSYVLLCLMFNMLLCLYVTMSVLSVTMSNNQSAHEYYVL